ncbi:MAG TPA: hypothetical protein VMD30_01975 [Tepidisphaeraceae bacterium]|nr:hypothetical protein [Tepidisphaeraceae bacterium]
MPIPVSATLSKIAGASPSLKPTVTVTVPFSGVNFTLFSTRFFKIRFTSRGSLCHCPGPSSTVRNSTPFWRAKVWIVARTVSSTSAVFTRATLGSRCGSSTLERSSRSRSMSSSRPRCPSMTVMHLNAWSRSSSNVSRSVSNAILIAVMGVRNSWLALATKSVFICTAPTSAVISRSTTSTPPPAVRTATAS